MERTTPEVKETWLKQEARATWPSLSFYYGLSFNDIIKMPRWARQMYADELPALLASQQLRAIEAASFPNYGEQGQKQIMDRYMKALPESAKEKPQAPRTKIELAALGAAAGFGIVFEPKDEPESKPSEEVTDA